VTVPVGVPLPETGVTVAVITTGPLAPTGIVEGAKLRVVVVAGLEATFRIWAGEVDPTKLLSPL
jgi:hypothetical protein